MKHFFHLHTSLLSFLLTLPLIAILLSCASFRLNHHVSKKIDWQEKKLVILRELHIYPPEYYSTYEKMLLEAFRFAFFKTGQSIQLSYSSPNNLPTPPLFPPAPSPSPTSNPNLIDILNKPLTKDISETDVLVSTNLNLKTTNPTTSPLVNFNTSSIPVDADLFLIINRKDNPSELRTFYSVTVGMVLSEFAQPQVISESRIYYDNIEFIDFPHIQFLIDELVSQSVLNSQIETKTE